MLHDPGPAAPSTHGPTAEPGKPTTPTPPPATGRNWCFRLGNPTPVASVEPDPRTTSVPWSCEAQRCPVLAGLLVTVRRDPPQSLAWASCLSLRAPSLGMEVTQLGGWGWLSIQLLADCPD
ncbi:protein NDNF-like [Platysternon megacephalum]|uniref:Protein NDNF-like n=1 Tax=Platysternon megacephalum TaxID=55544 RepID=A0A4D9EKB9_9SAUR|nr:protein NDNF-like [Platysternon megacephalum]